MDIFQSIAHRMNLLESTHADLSDDQQRIKWNTNELDLKIVTELNLLKKETASILEECNQIHKAIFTIGSSLREKISKQELQVFEELTNQWPVESFITSAELPIIFDKYAKKQTKK